jgi:serine phosphatase RsbU (regulator of sigma subunit)
VGDVSGKGVAAALLMARLSAAVRFALATEPNLPAVVRYLNRLFIRAENSDRFITFVVAILDRSSYQLTVVNAGHPPPLLRHRNGGVVPMGEAEIGLPLAVFDQPYEQVVVPFDPGDTLVLYTDGITEARNPRREFFGPDRLRAIVQATGADVNVLGAVLLSDLRQFVADRPPRDDLTVVCCRRAG